MPRKYLSSVNNKVAKKASASRDELVKEAQQQYAKASKSGGSAYASATSRLAKATDAAKKDTFDTWTESDLKKYLDSYGIPVYQGSNINDLRAAVRRNAQYFHYGTSTPSGTILARLQEGAYWLFDQLKLGASSGRAQGQEAADAVREKTAQASEKVRQEL